MKEARELVRAIGSSIVLALSRVLPWLDNLQAALTEVYCVTSIKKELTYVSEIDDIEWAKTVMMTLLEFNPLSAVLKEIVSFLSLATDVIPFRSKFNISVEGKEVEAIRSLVEIWKRATSSPAPTGSTSLALPFADPDAVLHVAEFGRVTAGQHVEGFICGWLKAFSVNASLAFISELTNSILALPSSAFDILKKIQAIKGISDAHGKMKQGTSVGLGVLTHTLSKLQGYDVDNDVMFTSVDTFNASLVACQALWDKEFEHLTKHIMDCKKNV